MITTALSDVHWWGVAAGTVLFGLLGGVWFTAIVKKPYAAAVGREQGAPAPTSPMFIAGSLICSLATVVTTALIFAALHIDTVSTAVGFGVLIGAGYLTAMAFNIAINPVFARPLLYGIVNAPYFIIARTGASALLVLLP